MFKNQLQELAQRSCFNLPSYSCIREGPDHAPRFKAAVNFNGETFESPSFWSTLRQAEHAAAEVALATLAERGPSKTLAARVLDETGVYKNLVQETAHRAGLNLPVYTTIRTRPGQVPVFSCTVELAGLSFSGKPARTKKLAQNNAAMAAWSALRTLSQQDSSSSTSSSPVSLDSKSSEEREEIVVARALSRLQLSRITHPCSESTSLIPILTTEINLHQLWQQQWFLFGLSLPSPLPPPRVYPFMQFLPRPVPNLLVSSSDLTSGVTIQEIQEEKPEEFSQKIGRQDHVEVQSRTGNVRIETRQAERCRQWPPAYVSSNYRSKPVDFRIDAGRSYTGSSSLITPRPRNLTMAEASMRLNPGPFPYSPRFGYENYHHFGTRPSSMAPAVRVRSVVPVCSAPPLRKMPSSNQEGESSTKERKI